MHASPNLILIVQVARSTLGGRFCGVVRGNDKVLALASRQKSPWLSLRRPTDDYASWETG